MKRFSTFIDEKTLDEGIGSLVRKAKRFAYGFTAAGKADAAEKDLIRQYDKIKQQEPNYVDDEIEKLKLKHYPWLDKSKPHRANRVIQKEPKPGATLQSKPTNVARGSHTKDPLQGTRQQKQVDQFIDYERKTKPVVQALTTPTQQKPMSQASLAKQQARAEREQARAEREQAKAERERIALARSREREQARAEKEAEREQARAEREAEREQARAEREQARAEREAEKRRKARNKQIIGFAKWVVGSPPKKRKKKEERDQYGYTDSDYERWGNSIGD